MNAAGPNSAGDVFRRGAWTPIGAGAPLSHQRNQNSRFLYDVIEGSKVQSVFTLMIAERLVEFEDPELLNTLGNTQG